MEKQVSWDLSLESSANLFYIFIPIDIKFMEVHDNLLSTIAVLFWYNQFSFQHGQLQYDSA